LIAARSGCRIVVKTITVKVWNDLVVQDNLPVGTSSADYDAVHAALTASELMPTLWAEAFGDDYPGSAHVVDPQRARRVLTGRRGSNGVTRRS
jgi:hypothetical protein